jgi:uncharacterized protein (TIGR03083 family)
MNHRSRWRAEAGRFADLLDRADLEAPVPGCPEWNAADLAFHLGWVYDRFGQVVRGRMTGIDQIRELVPVDRPEDDRALPEWFRARFGALDAALADLVDDEPLWNFTKAPQVGAWLPRRMLHETTVHRHDLEEAIGQLTPIEAQVARDGVDELLTVLATAGKRWDGEDPVVLRVEEVPDGPTWQLRWEPDERPVVDEAADPDVILRGEPVELLLALWRRASLSSVGFTGPESLAEKVLAVLSR